MVVRRLGRKYRPVEYEYLSQFVAEYYPDAKVMLNVRLGTPPESLVYEDLSESEQRMLTVYRRFCDAVIITDHELIVVEATMWPKPQKTAELELYLNLVPHTPELQQYLDRRLVGMIVCPIDDPVMRQIVESKGFRYVVYRPEWTTEFYSKYPPSWQSAARWLPESTR